MRQNLVSIWKLGSTNSILSSWNVKSCGEGKQGNAQDELIEEANKLIKNFNAEMHLIQAMINQFLKQYWDLDDDLDYIGEEIGMDEYLEILEKERKAITDRIRENSPNKEK